MPADAKPMSALHLFFKMPVEKTIKLPMFEPEPNCGKTNKDLTYKFSGAVPEWLSLDESKRSAEVEVDDASLVGTNVPVEVAASIGSVEEKVSFAIVFKDESEVIEPEQGTEDIEKEDDTDEEEETEEEEDT